MVGYDFGESMPMNWYVAAISLCHFFQSVINIASLNSKN